MAKLFPGQILWCENGETVILKQIQYNNIIVEYKGKQYMRPLNIIGQKLFTQKNIIKLQPIKNVHINHPEPPIENNIQKIPINDSEMDYIQSAHTMYTCSDCVMQRCGDCFGKGEICEDFKYTPRLDVGLSNGTPCGDATFFKMHGRSRN